MVILRITGHFSYIDKYNRLKFVFLEEDNCREKLAEHCKGKLPFDDSGFTVMLPKGTKYVPNDIKNKVGLECALHVKLIEYDFVSKLESNFGERVTGT
jgi:hypothetical protein